MHSISRGFVYDRMGQYAKAIEDYSLALKIDGTSHFAFYNRGIALDKLGKYRDAIAGTLRLRNDYYVDFTSASKFGAKEPVCADYYLNRGLAYMKLGDVANGQHDFSLALEIQPRHLKVSLVSFGLLSLGIVQ